MAELPRDEKRVGREPSADAQWRAFLAWALPRLGLRWAGFRNVRGQVQKRLARRIHELGLSDIASYRERVEHDPDEWQFLDRASRITISRFLRDRQVYEGLRSQVLPTLIHAARARGASELCAWSAGCASGEEPYSLALVHQLGLPEDSRAFPLSIMASDAEAHMLERARRGCYERGSLHEVPETWIAQAFEAHETGELCLQMAFRQPVTLRQDDVRSSMPDGPFDLVLCRNLVLTYFEPPLQREVLTRMAARMVQGAALIVGAHEHFPEGLESAFQPWPGLRCTFRRL